MTSSQPLLLNPLTLPLKGEHLIEASAGTGKTFTIALLYLRLLLGLDGENVYEQPLSVEEILVVTFTKAATAELRGRIRDNIHQLRIACIRGTSSNKIYQSLLMHIPNLKEAASLLLAAERQMDQAAIFTIHGFCQRMLSLNAFESSVLFEQKLIEDEKMLLKQATEDFWRRQCYPLTLEVARLITSEWSGPDTLLNTLNPFLKSESPKLKHSPPIDETLTSRHAYNLQRIADIKKKWQILSADIEGIIATSDIDKSSYNSKYLHKWITKLTTWANNETLDYQLPKELKHFAQQKLEEKTKKGKPPKHSLFTEIDAFLAEPLSLRDVMLSQALIDVRCTVQREKRLRTLLGFDDLLSRLDNALHQPSGAMLAESIRRRFPVALIDEFQDTDPLQYRIFRMLYINQPKLALLLIGDPKQAIYAFRGADIFTYLQAKNEISSHYTLNTNWRSSPDMVNSVNRLFSQVSSPFLFTSIPFHPIYSAVLNEELKFLYQKKQQPALRFWLQPGEGTSIINYQQFMACQCAADISRWLLAGQSGEVLIGKGQVLRPVKASDITVLVRSRNEATLIRDALNALLIPSVYLSSRDSVYTTPEARELLWLLQAIQAPEQAHLLRRALATSIFGIDAKMLDFLSQHEREWDALIEQFMCWQQLWYQHSVLSMLRDLIMKRKLAENMLASKNGERRLTDLMHIGELLQEAATQLDSPHALVRFLAQQISQPNIKAANQQLRLDSDRHLVQIVTIHKSKGLQYPLVWLPFAAGFREATSALYHDRASFNTILDVRSDMQSIMLAEEERLAEDLRLLYVALTRSVYHCSIGIAPLMKGNRKKKGKSDLHNSALGYLVQRGQTADAAQLLDCLNVLADDNIEIKTDEILPGVVWHDDETSNEMLFSRNITRILNDSWQVTSYSSLQQHRISPLLETLPKFDIDAAGEIGSTEKIIPLMTPHHFPRGAVPGTFLHKIFESIDFTEDLDEIWLENQLKQHGYPPVWLPFIQKWIIRVLTTLLNRDGLTLSQIKNNDRLIEMEFYLPIHHFLSEDKLNTLLRRHDQISQRAAPLEFRQVQGMLKGFIDLVFRWKGKYYLLDYKSNWLGENQDAYTLQALEQAMINHRYDLQYQLYTLALHRYLKHRLTNYNYDLHFGGVFYLFLRGFDASDSIKNGIFATRPSKIFIEEIDVLFGSTEDTP